MSGRKSNYDSSYPDRIFAAALTIGKISNRDAASVLGVSASTISEWRKNHEEFDQAFDDAHQKLKHMLNKNVLRIAKGFDKLTIETGKNKDGQWAKRKTEKIEASAKDIEIISSLIGRTMAANPKEKAFIKRVLKRLSDQRITAIEAMRLIEAEGYKVPVSVELEAKAQIQAEYQDDFSDLEHMSDEELERFISRDK